MNLRKPGQAKRRALLILGAVALVGASIIALPGAANAASGDVVTPVSQKYKGPIVIEPSIGTWDTPISHVSTDGASFSENYGVVSLSVVKGNLSDAGTIVNLSRGGYTGPPKGPYDFGSTAALKLLSFAAVAPSTLDQSSVGTTFAVTLSGGVNNSLTGNYFRADLEVVDLGGGVTGWKVSGTPDNAKPLPTVTIVGQAQADGTSVKLSSTVQNPDGTIAAGAPGAVEFAVDGNVLTSVPVQDGLADFTTPSYFEHDHDYTFSARYVPAATDPYFNSTVASLLVNTGDLPPADPQQTESTDVTVTIPAPTSTALTLSVADGGVTLGDASESGGGFTASGALPTATITDGRADKTAWSFNGVSSALTNAADSSKTIASSNLGWAKPTVTGGAVAGDAASDLSAERVLASWVASTQPDVVTSTIDTTVSLNAPAETAEGSYSGTLTLTLI